MNTMNQKIRPVTYALALYFLLMVTDSFPLMELGSMLRFLALIPLAFSLLELRHLRLRINFLVGVLLLFWLMAAVSLFYSVEVGRTVESLNTLTLNLALVYMMGAAQQYSRREAMFLGRAMLCGSWMTILLILLFSNFSIDGRLSLQLGESIQDQNYINGYILVAFSYHCSLALNQYKWKHLIPALLIVGIVLMTGSRGALVAYAAVAMLYLILMVMRSGRPLRNMTVLIMVAILSSVFFEIILARMPQDVAVRFSWDYLVQNGTSGRFRIWNYLWEHFCDDSLLRMLFGHGYGTTPVVNQATGLVAHNLYLDNLITLGLVGVSLQLLAQGFVLRELLRQRSMTMLGAYVGMLVMCLSLSLTAYKPLWGMMMMSLILHYSKNEEEGGGNRL